MELKNVFLVFFEKNEKYYKAFLYQNILNVINSVILFKRILFFYIKKRFMQYFSCDRFPVFKKTVYLINNWILLKVSE